MKKREKENEREERKRRILFEIPLLVPVTGFSKDFLYTANITFRIRIATNMDKEKKCGCKQQEEVKKKRKKNLK